MLSDTTIKNLAPHLEPVTLNLKQILHPPDVDIRDVYFLETGICSIVVGMKDGTTVEVGIIGRDNFVGMPVLLGTGRSRNCAFMQLAGAGYKVKAAILRQQLVEDSGELRMCLLRGVQGLLTQVAQTAACNRVHEIQERMARWLLMCQTRTQSDALPLTHEFLATMLGTRRSTVSVASGMLQKAGLITHKRGTVNIENREGLQAAACECYAAVEDEYARLQLL
jgi:CRP-like cAMP-binding protein